jgi:serine/threonine-protein kinase
MTLAPGIRVGAYEVIAFIGAGGMGEVYRARDTRLRREVALKVLPELFALDSDRLARFQREAQILASLNHPNIAAIHGLEESDGTRALALELVEGPTLADRVAEGPIGLAETLSIARQIAEVTSIAGCEAVSASIPRTTWHLYGPPDGARIIFSSPRQGGLDLYQRASNSS